MTFESRLILPDAELWFKASGSGQPVVYLHGGPGYNCYTFEKFAGSRFEKDFRMIYFDQRGSGRSTITSKNAPLNVSVLVSDLEQLVDHIGLDKINLIGHSFGALLSLEYLKLHAHKVSRVILVDICPDISLAAAHQVNYLREFCQKLFPDKANLVLSILRERSADQEKLAEIYNLVGPQSFSEAMFWHESSFAKLNTELDLESGIMHDGRNIVAEALQSSGYLTDRNEHLHGKLQAPAALFYGKHSHCIGKQNIVEAARNWDIPIHEFEHSGHFPYAEQPETFVYAAKEFFFTPSNATLSKSNPNPY